MDSQCRNRNFLWDHIHCPSKYSFSYMGSVESGSQFRGPDICSVLRNTCFLLYVCIYICQRGRGEWCVLREHLLELNFWDLRGCGCHLISRQPPTVEKVERPSLSLNNIIVESFSVTFIIYFKITYSHSNITVSINRTLQT